jgi:hypothetical protein
VTFTLNITFQGLLMFVPDSLRNQLHVLMPATSGIIEQHFPRLSYDNAYGIPGSTQLSSTNALREMDQIALTFKFDTGEPDALQPALPLTVCPIYDYADQDLKRWLVGPKPADKVVSRVTLAAGQYSTNTRGARWLMGGVEIELAFDLVWTITVDSPQTRGRRKGSSKKRAKSPLEYVTVCLSGLNGATTPGDFNLYPVPDKNTGAMTIELCVSHLDRMDELTKQQGPGPNPQDDMDTPGIDEPAAHFVAYYAMFDNPADRMIPTYSRAAVPDPSVAPSTGLKPVTCINAQATVR